TGERVHPGAEDVADDEQHQQLGADRLLQGGLLGRFLDRGLIGRGHGNLRDGDARRLRQRRALVGAVQLGPGATVRELYLPAAPTTPRRALIGSTACPTTWVIVGPVAAPTIGPAPGATGSPTPRPGPIGSEPVEGPPAQNLSAGSKLRGLTITTGTRDSLSTRWETDPSTSLPIEVRRRMPMTTSSAPFSSIAARMSSAGWARRGTVRSSTSRPVSASLSASGR